MREGRKMAPDLTEIMTKKIEEDAQTRTQQECREIVQRSENLKNYLVTIARAGRWSLPLTIRGMEISHPEHQKNLELLERCGLVESRIRYTEHNTYREYTVTEQGASLVRKKLLSQEPR